MLLIHAVTAVLALSSPQAQPLPDQLVIAAVVTDKEGHAVTDLKPDEIVVQENGADRPTVRAERDARPLKVALVLDSSAAMGGAYASDVVPAAVAFLKRLPAGTGFTVWSTSDHPRRIVDEGTDLKAAEDKMRTLAPFGANAAVDTLVEASRDAGAFDDQHGAVVIVTSASMEGVTVDLQSLLPKASFKPTLRGRGSGAQLGRSGRAAAGRAEADVVADGGVPRARVHDDVDRGAARARAGFAGVAVPRRVEARRRSTAGEDRSEGEAAGHEGRAGDENFHRVVTLVGQDFSLPYSSFARRLSAIGTDLPSA